MAVRRWNANLDGPFSEGALRRKLEAAGYVVARYTRSAGTIVPDQVHDIDSVDAVVAGTVRLVVAGHLAMLGPGDWVEVPRGVRRTATVIGAESVVGLNGVRPPPRRG